MQIILLVFENKPSPEAAENEGLFLLFAETARSLGQTTAPLSGATHVLRQNRVSCFWLWVPVLSVGWLIFRLVSYWETFGIFEALSLICCQLIYISEI